MFFVVQKLFGFMGSYLLIVGLYTCAAGAVQKLHSYPKEFSLFPTFYFVRFGVSGLMLRSFIQLELSVVQNDKYE